MGEAWEWISFQGWQERAHDTLQHSPLWQSVVYRKAMYLYDLTWEDSRLLAQDFRGKAIAQQLIRSVGSISANLEESYGRGVRTPDSRRILRIALGEARESKGWYLRSHHLLPEEVMTHRLNLLEEIIRLLVRAIRT